jgi:hypothetical protein
MLLARVRAADGDSRLLDVELSNGTIIAIECGEDDENSPFGVGDVLLLNNDGDTLERASRSAWGQPFGVGVVRHKDSASTIVETGTVLLDALMITPSPYPHSYLHPRVAAGQRRLRDLAGTLEVTVDGSISCSTQTCVPSA